MPWLLSVKSVTVKCKKYFLVGAHAIRIARLNRTGRVYAILRHFSCSKCVFSWFYHQVQLKCLVIGFLSNKKKVAHSLRYVCQKIDVWATLGRSRLRTQKLNICSKTSFLLWFWCLAPQNVPLTELHWFMTYNNQLLKKKLNKTFKNLFGILKNFLCRPWNGLS